MLTSKKLRYLLIGGLNTLIGFSIGVGMYKALENILGIIWIGVISNILSITVSFLTYKLFVFRTKGMWFTEYLKAYVVYGGISIVGIFSLWVFVDIMKISIWFAQALVISVTVIFSYIGHSRITFRRREV